MISVSLACRGVHRPTKPNPLKGFDHTWIRLNPIRWLWQSRIGLYLQNLIIASQVVGFSRNWPTQSNRWRKLNPTRSTRSGKILSKSGKISIGSSSFWAFYCLFSLLAIPLPMLTNTPTTYEEPNPCNLLLLLNRPRVEVYSTWFDQVEYKLSKNYTRLDP